ASATCSGPTRRSSAASPSWNLWSTSSARPAEPAHTEAPVGLLDTILGRSKPVRANLDALFALPTAALTLQSAGGLVTSGHAGVCWKPPPGQGAADAQKEISELVGEGFRNAVDSFDYGWLILDDADLEELVTKIHMANSTLQENGWG